MTEMGTLSGHMKYNGETAQSNQLQHNIHLHSAFSRFAWRDYFSVCGNQRVCDLFVSSQYTLL